MRETGCLLMVAHNNVIITNYVQATIDNIQKYSKCVGYMVAQIIE